MLNNRYKTTLITKADVVDRDSDKFKSMASALQNKYGFDLKPQMDLLYVKSCLVTAGEEFGINENDDVFTREQAWAARHTPVLKPANWQHQDKDILGVVYSIEARTLDGQVIPFDQEEPPAEEFEFYTEAVVFKLIHPERAEEIANRASANDLYVSMEAWFDDYEYGLYDASGKLQKIIARNEDTKFLDSHLRCKGGVGTYNNCRLGRILKDITFGGYGFVDKPANKRSIIEQVDAVPAAASIEDRVETLVREFLAKSEKEETGLVKTKASENEVVVSAADIKAAVAEVLAEHKNAEEKMAAEASLQAKAEQLGDANTALETDNTSLKEAVEAKDAEIEGLKEQVSELGEIAESLSASLKEVIAAAPALASEISGIDAVTDGDSAWNAKIALFKSMGSVMTAAASRIEELETEAAKAAQQTRANEVHGLLDGLLAESEVDALVAVASELSDDDYEAWSEEKALFSMALQEAHAAKKNPFEKKDEEGKDMKKEKKSDAASDGELTLVQKAIKARMEGLINHPGKEDLKSGVTPGAPGLSTPRHKIAGSAEADLTVLEQALAEDGVNPAGASMGEGAEGTDSDPYGFRSLAMTLTGNDEEGDEADKGDGPNFDPVS